ncbi:MAG TPA: acyl carrier protein [Gaiellaceae bacterium]|nr:acyl carrier protein [Gaiellaceae bacterium]
MSRDEIRTAVLRILGDIAPEADPDTLRPDVDLREQLDIDSMDFLNFVIGIDQELGVSIPEREYPRLATLDGCVDYLAEHLATSQG